MRKNTLSFIAPRKKYLLSKFIKAWILYITISSLIVYGYQMVIEHKLDSLFKDTEGLKIARQKLLQENNKLNDSYEKLQKNVDFYHAANQNNKKIEQVISSFLKLIPDQIELNDIKIEKHMLTIKGIAPSKDIYKYLLGDSLRSIFDESIVNFYKINNKTYSFISVNKITQQGRNL